VTFLLLRRHSPDEKLTETRSVADFLVGIMVKQLTKEQAEDFYSEHKVMAH
jgi:hypothetical protein